MLPVGISHTLLVILSLWVCFTDQANFLPYAFFVFFGPYTPLRQALFDCPPSHPKFQARRPGASDGIGYHAPLLGRASPLPSSVPADMAPSHISYLYKDPFIYFMKICSTVVHVRHTIHEDLLRSDTVRTMIEFLDGLGVFLRRQTTSSPVLAARAISSIGATLRFLSDSLIFLFTHWVNH